jgi:hypothetical protein
MFLRQRENTKYLKRCFLCVYITRCSSSGEFSTPRKLAAGVPQYSVLVSVLYSLYISDVPTAPGTHFPLFADDTCIYVTKKHELHIVCQVQRCLTAMNSWCDRWNININEGETQAIYFSTEVPDDVLQLK